MKNNVNNEISQIRKMMGLKENFEPMAEDINSGEGVEMPKDKAEEPEQNDDMHEVQMVIISQLSDLQENGGGDMMKGKIDFVKSLVMALGDGKKEMSGAEIDVMYDKCCGSVQENMKMNMGLTMEGKAHGSPYDRGHSDAYYGRERDPHKYPEGTYNGERVTDLTPEEIKAYNDGYDGTSTFKDFGEMPEEDWLLKQKYNKTEGELGEPNFQKKAEGGDGVYEETVKEGYYDEIEGYTSTSQNQSGYKDGDTVKHQHLGQTGTVYDVLVAPNKKDFLVVVKFDTGNGMKSIGKYGVGFSDINDIKKA